MATPYAEATNLVGDISSSHGVGAKSSSGDTYRDLRSHSARKSLTAADTTMLEVKDVLKRAESVIVNDIHTWRDRFAYWAENVIASNSNYYFIGLMILTFILVITLGVFWMICDRLATGTLSLSQSLFYTMQVMASGGFNSSVVNLGPAIVYLVAMLSGLIVFAILIGMINERFLEFTRGIAAGRSNVTESGHTLILGWNETTVRVVCQLALLRQAFQKQNETCVRRIFFWSRVAPSTPVAQAPIVLLNNTKSKAEMQGLIKKAFLERGIPLWRTRVGVDVVCRVGQPTDIQDLQLVGAHRAIAILVQMNEDDLKEKGQHDGTIENGMTLRVLLGLRVALFSAQPPPRWDDLRIVVQLTSPDKAIDVINLGEASYGRPVMACQDLSIFLNGLMFNCTLQPGLSYTLLNILSFEGVAFRLRQVKSLPDGGKQVIGKTFKELALVYEDAIPCGFIAGDDRWQPEPSEDCGLVPTGDRKICADDRLIFAAESPWPIVNRRGDTETIEEGVADVELGEEPPMHVLVCGWRPQWNDPGRFAFRIRDTAEDLPSKSSITFLCTKGKGVEGAFADFMDEVCQQDKDMSVKERGNNLWTFQHCVEVRYVPGDAADYRVLEKVVKSNNFNQAIIVSTKANEVLSPLSRDTRVMSIMLYLRHLQTVAGKEDLHIIGENSMDSTSFLALGPLAKNEPDFVNVHALYARVLTQSLAYPRMGTALAQLFAGKPGMPAIRLESAGNRIPLGSFTFGSLVQLFKKLLPEDVLLGLRQADGQMIIAPRLSDLIDCTRPDCWLILMTRRFTNAQLKSETQRV